MKQVRLFIGIVVGCLAPLAANAAPIASYYFNNSAAPERQYHRHTECEIHADKIIIRNHVGGIMVTKQSAFSLEQDQGDKLNALIAKVAATPLEDRGGAKQYYIKTFKVTHEGEEIVVSESRDGYLATRRSADVNDFYSFFEQTCQLFGYVGAMNPR